MIVDRLIEVAEQHAPMRGAAVVGGQPRLIFAPTATAPQQAAAWAAVHALDWSPAAVAAWKLVQERKAVQASWDARAEMLFRAFALVVLDEINVLRSQHSLPARTIAQLKAATLSKIQSGSAD